MPLAGVVSDDWLGLLLPRAAPGIGTLVAVLVGFMLLSLVFRRLAVGGGPPAAQQGSRQMSAASSKLLKKAEQLSKRERHDCKMVLCVRKGIGTTWLLHLFPCSGLLCLQVFKCLKTV
eukprot:GHVT01033366.1.p1 GENE.GHVT01033366.1~~GHVT01033366.1.p1  ORF type:complete len:118 (+),score=13.23 GHVT01033366.1:2208-2561(+)